MADDDRRSRPMNITLSKAASDQLDELAAGAGIRRAALARALFEELLPTVTGVRHRLQITTRANGARPSDG
jgi:hypothetical protein